VRAHNHLPANRRLEFRFQVTVWFSEVALTATIAWWMQVRAIPRPSRATT